MEIMQEYQDKLAMNDYISPNIFCLKDWLSGEDGISFWSSSHYHDISNCLAFNLAEFASKELSDYKNSKAYSYSISG